MKQYETSQLRNVALVSHSGTGKTSLAESALWVTKTTKRLGKVDDGNSSLDYTEDELERKLTLSLKLAPVETKTNKITLIDTPGYADFAGDQVAGLHVADAALMLLRGDAGVEAATELVWDRVERAGRPVLLVISQMGREGADFNNAVASAREGLSDRMYPAFLPIGSGDSFTGVVDVLANKAYEYTPDGKGEFKTVDVPADMADELAEARASLIDAAAEGDDALVEKYLEGEELTEEEVWTGMQKAIRAGTMIPVVPTDAMTGVGVAHLLESIIHFLPSPADVGAATATKGDREVEVAPDASAKPSCFVFKTQSEGHVGDMFLVRVFSGTLSSGLDLSNAGRGGHERIGQPAFLIGKERVDAESLIAGDIGALVKLKDSRTGDTLSEKELSIQLPAIPFPAPTLTEAIVSKEKGEEEKVGMGLHKLVDEDPTLQFKNDGALRQTLLLGLGDVQLELVARRLKRRFGVEVEMAKPRIPYKETIRGKTEIQGRYKKQTGGRGQFGDVHLRIEPTPRGEGFEFRNEITGGVVPGKFIPAVEKGIRETMTDGVVAGYPVVDVRAALYFGSYHSVDSSEMAFKIAASMAFKQGFEKCQPILLEPVMEVTVTVPDEFMGDVMGDVSSKRGKILGMDSVGKRKILRAQVPQGEMYRYSTHLRALTQGRAWHAESFSHYEEVPGDQMEKVVAEAKHDKEHASA